jgi:hypothetical protein
MGYALDEVPQLAHVGGQSALRAAMLSGVTESIRLPDACANSSMKLHQHGDVLRALRGQHHDREAFRKK